MFASNRQTAGYPQSCALPGWSSSVRSTRSQRGGAPPGGVPPGRAFEIASYRGFSGAISAEKETTPRPAWRRAGGRVVSSPDPMVGRLAVRSRSLCSRGRTRSLRPPAPAGLGHLSRQSPLAVPVREQDAQVRRSDYAVTVEVTHRRVRDAPEREHEAQVRGPDAAVEV